MTPSMVVQSINVGMPAQVSFGGKEISTGIHKIGVRESLYLSRLNLDGDRQADLVHHGGVDKAVCVYPYEHYAYWETELDRSLAYGAFGENLTTEGMLEKDVCIGDIYRFGEAVVQVSQPRQPCFKLGVKYGVPELPLKVQQTGYTGYYFRVLSEGMVSTSDTLVLEERHPAKVTISFANSIMYHEKGNIDEIQRILDVQELSDSWRQTLTKRLGG